MIATTICCLALLFQPTPSPAAAGPAAVHYTIRANDALGVDDTIWLDVEMRVEGAGSRTVIGVPVWTPGSYRLREFPQRIHAVAASAADGTALEVVRLHHDRWEVEAGQPTGELTVRYRVELREDDRFMLRGERRRCITYEGPAVYLYVRDALHVPHHVRFDIPDDWRIACGLDPAEGGGFVATDYDVLVDCPVKLGAFQDWRFESFGKPIRVVVDGPGDIEFGAEEFVANIRKLVDAQGAMFGGLPFEHYVFLYTASPEGGGGGLEHLTSTTIGVRTEALRRSPMAAMSTTSHELFHAWNVKRLRPRELGPFDYTGPNHTTSLWLMEGFTSYYGAVFLTRAGLEDAEAMWQGLGRRIGAFESNPARSAVSSADASRAVWDKVPDDRRLDYYTSGLVLGLLLDIEIRQRTGNQRSLDDLMRALFELCRDAGRGYDESELRELADRTAGSDLGSFFDRYVYGTRIPPYAEILAHAGIDIELVTRETRSVRGLFELPRDGGLFYQDPDAAPGRAGLRSQGRVSSVAGQAVQKLAEVNAMLAAAAPDARLELVVDSAFGERTLRVPIETVRRSQVRDFELDEDAPAAALAIRHGIERGLPARPSAR